MRKDAQDPKSLCAPFRHSATTPFFTSTNIFMTSKKEKPSACLTAHWRENTLPRGQKHSFTARFGAASSLDALLGSSTQTKTGFHACNHTAKSGSFNIYVHEPPHHPSLYYDSQNIFVPIRAHLMFLIVKLLKFELAHKSPSIFHALIM